MPLPYTLCTRCKNIYFIQFNIECVHCIASFWIEECAAITASHASKFWFSFCVLQLPKGMAMHMENRLSDQIIRPISGRKCYALAYLYLLLIWQRLWCGRFIMLKPVQLLIGWNCWDLASKTMKSIQLRSNTRVSNVVITWTLFSTGLVHSSVCFLFIWLHATHKISNQKHYSTLDILFYTVACRNHGREKER